MQNVLIVVHLMVVIALVVIVLLQRSEGGGLGMGSSSGGFMTGRGQANLLTRTTAILAAAFFATSLTLTILAGHPGTGGGGSLFSTPAPSSAPAGVPANSSNNLLEQLGGGAKAPATPVVPAPAAPAPVTPAPAPAAPAAPAR